MMIRSASTFPREVAKWTSPSRDRDRWLRRHLRQDGGVREVTHESKRNSFWVVEARRCTDRCDRGVVALLALSW